MSARDATQEAYRATAIILTSCKHIEGPLKDYLLKNDERPEISFDLLRIVTYADDLLQMVQPDKVQGEFHGVPACALDTSGKRAIRFRHNDRPSGWDFAAWYGEKATGIKQGARDLVRYWLMDVKDVTLSEMAPVSPREWLREMILMSYRQVQGYARVVFDEIHKDGLVLEETYTGPDQDIEK